MTSKSWWILTIVCLNSCQQIDIVQIANTLAIPEPKKWILVIHPEGCKTCLDSFYEELMTLPPSEDGAIVILAKNTKTLRMNPLVENSPIPLYLDEEKLLIQENLVDPTDQILVFSKDGVKGFDILDYQKALEELNIK
jgi:hypothetical protein